MVKHILCYTGHGSIFGWAHEQVLTETDFGNWVNPKYVSFNDGGYL